MAAVGRACELLDGSWFHGRTQVYGRLRALTDPPLDLAADLPLRARVRMLVDGPDERSVWPTVPILGDGTFMVDARIDEGQTMTVQAWFDRTDRLGPSVSEELVLGKP